MEYTEFFHFFVVYSKIEQEDDSYDFFWPRGIIPMVFTGVQDHRVPIPRSHDFFLIIKGKNSYTYTVGKLLEPYYGRVTSIL